MGHRFISYVINSSHRDIHDISISNTSLFSTDPNAAGLLVIVMLLGLATPIQAQNAAPAWQSRCADENDAATCTKNQQLFLNQDVDGQRQQVGRLLNPLCAKIDTGPTDGGRPINLPRKCRFQ